jgi:hypothetical protein
MILLIPKINEMYFIASVQKEIPIKSIKNIYQKITEKKEIKKSLKDM